MADTDIVTRDPVSVEDIEYVSDTDERSGPVVEPAAVQPKTPVPDEHEIYSCAYAMSLGIYIASMLYYAGYILSCMEPIFDADTSVSTLWVIMDNLMCIQLFASIAILYVWLPIRRTTSAKESFGFFETFTIVLWGITAFTVVIFIIYHNHINRLRNYASIIFVFHGIWVTISSPIMMYCYTYRETPKPKLE